jgi:hypothetical protein
MYLRPPSNAAFTALFQKGQGFFTPQVNSQPQWGDVGVAFPAPH